MIIETLTQTLLIILYTGVFVGKESTHIPPDQDRQVYLPVLAGKFYSLGHAVSLWAQLELEFLEVDSSVPTTTTLGNAF